MLTPGHVLEDISNCEWCTYSFVNTVTDFSVLFCPRQHVSQLPNYVASFPGARYVAPGQSCWVHTRKPASTRGDCTSLSVMCSICLA